MKIARGKLQELHRIHRQLTDLRERLARGPKLIAAAEGSVKTTEQQLVEAKDAYRKGRMGVDEKQLHLKQRESRVKDLQGRLNACENNREYQILNTQIAADQKANSVLEDEILEGIEVLEALQAEMKLQEGNVVKVQDELVRVRQRVQEQQAGLESELARVQAELGRAEEDLPEDFRVEYTRVTKARGEQALAPLEGQSCGGCYQTLTPQTVNDVLAGRPVFCRSCGVLLYPTAE
ncbi:MAG: zinc ribbon domain-containing protein [Planctomycetota bacterium]